MLRRVPRQQTASTSRAWAHEATVAGWMSGAPRRAVAWGVVGLLVAGWPQHAAARDLAVLGHVSGMTWGVDEPPSPSPPDPGTTAAPEAAPGVDPSHTPETASHGDAALPAGVIEVSHDGTRRTRTNEPSDLGGARDDSPNEVDGRVDPSQDTPDATDGDLPDPEGEAAFEDDGEVDFGASGEDSYDPLRDSPEALKARHWMIAGIVGTTVGAILGAGAIATAAVDPCLTGGGNNCFEDARNRAAAIMGVPAAVMVLGGVGMISYGAVQRRKLRASVASDGVTTLFTVQGRF